MAFMIQNKDTISPPSFSLSTTTPSPFLFHLPPLYLGECIERERKGKNCDNLHRSDQKWPTNHTPGQPLLQPIGAGEND